MGLHRFLWKRLQNAAGDRAGLLMNYTVFIHLKAVVLAFGVIKG
jgi:hypothetical protein